jgi:hypothetical protein
MKPCPRSHKSKKKSELRHCKRRFLERTGVDLTQQMHDCFLTLIHNSGVHPEKIAFVEKQSNRVTVWDVKHEDKIYRCVYDKLRKQIVTVLNNTSAFLEPTESKLASIEKTNE